MNRHLFKPELNGSKLSGSLSLFSNVVFALGIFLAVVALVASLISGMILADDENSPLFFFLMLGVGLIGAALTFVAFYVCSIFLKAFASITLHSYISALNSENVVMSVAPSQKHK